ncbi:MAG TPA: class 1 fructose-bisphosphatase [Thermoanaerobaculia bacterium]|nr:class 1 fructose-bisphosphatase [Thermoanaerobaculia bacterium]
MPRPPVTLDRFILEGQHAHPGATGELSLLLMRLGVAGKRIARELAIADQAHTHGSAGTENVQGEEQKKLDVRANEILVETFDYGGLVSFVASEELEEPHVYRGTSDGARYLVLFDPMDGSSNIDVNGVLGTIFSVRPRRDGTERDLLRPGTDQVAAGYILFGPAVLFVYSSGDGVHVFSLDPSIGEFVHVRKRVQMPQKGRAYAVNEGRRAGWSEADRAFVEYLKENDPASGRPYSTRYSGSMVGDLHRILLEGGIYLYPADSSSGKPSGKIRMLYESHPLAFIAEQAGGRASTGRERVLALAPRSLHERIPVAIGSAFEIELYERFMQGERPGAASGPAAG